MWSLTVLLVLKMLCKLRLIHTYTCAHTHTHMQHTHACTHIPVGNKNDCPERKVVQTEDATKFADQIGIQLFETSAKENLNVEEVHRWHFSLLRLYTFSTSDLLLVCSTIIAYSLFLSTPHL